MLFHPSGELGYRFDGVHSISVFFDHISNGYSRRDNEGMDTIGVRFGRRLVPFSAPPTDDGAIADFSGLYVGAMAGYQFERADWRASSFSPSRADADDFHWAGLLGYSWQSGRGVFGIEVDASPAAHFLNATCVAPSTSCQMDVHGFYSVRPRFGWVIDRAMIYGTGGLAIANWDSTAVNTATGQRLGGSSATNFGVAVGAGIELKLTANLGGPRRDHALRRARQGPLHLRRRHHHRPVPEHRRPRRLLLVFQVGRVDDWRLARSPLRWVIWRRAITIADVASARH